MCIYIYVYPLTSYLMSRNLPSRHNSNNMKIHMHKVIHCPIICNSKILKKSQKCSYIRNWMNKLEHIHTIEHAVVKDNEKELYKLK